MGAVKVVERESAAHGGASFRVGAAVGSPPAACGEPAATQADGRFVYSERPTAISSYGSVPGFLGTLMAGAIVWLLAARSRPRVPAALRLTAATALAFA